MDAVPPLPELDAMAGACGEELELGDLPRELLLRVMEHLPAAAVVSLGRASQQFRELSLTEALWRAICTRDFGASTRVLAASGQIPSFRQHYASRQQRPGRAPSLSLSQLWWIADVYDWKDTLIHSAAIPPLTSWPSDGVVCAIPPCPIRPVPIGRRGNRQHVVGAPTALEDFQATMANVGSMRVRWSVMRTTDSKVAVIADEYPDTLTRSCRLDDDCPVAAGWADRMAMPRAAELPTGCLSVFLESTTVEPRMRHLHVSSEQLEGRLMKVFVGFDLRGDASAQVVAVDPTDTPAFERWQRERAEETLYLNEVFLRFDSFDLSEEEWPPPSVSDFGPVREALLALQWQ